MSVRNLFRKTPLSPRLVTVGAFCVEIRTRSQARRVTLRYDARKTRFAVSAPARTSLKFILEFLHQHQDWMEKQHHTAMPLVDPLATGRIFVQGIERHILHEEAAGVEVILQEDCLLVRCRPERLRRALLRYLKQHAEKTLGAIAREKARQAGKTIHSISLRDTTSRWGSCSHDGKLSFSWRLIMAPDFVIDYVVAHEVAHLQHFDHSPAFWSLCRSLSNDYTAGKHWLQLNGQSLQQVML